MVHIEVTLQETNYKLIRQPVETIPDMAIASVSLPGGQDKNISPIFPGFLVLVSYISPQFSLFPLHFGLPVMGVREGSRYAIIPDFGKE